MFFDVPDNMMMISDRFGLTMANRPQVVNNSGYLSPFRVIADSNLIDAKQQNPSPASFAYRR